MVTPSMDKFLGCVKLETGGHIIGWIWIVISLFAIGIYSSVIKVTADNESSIDPTVFQAIIILSAIFVIYHIFLFFASILLIIGIKRRAHSLLMPFMIVMVFGIFLSFAQIFNRGFNVGLSSAIIAAAVDIYFFFCVSLLYRIFKYEKLGQGTTQSTIATHEQQNPSNMAYNQHMNIYYQAHQPAHQTYYTNKNEKGWI